MSKINLNLIRINPLVVPVILAEELGIFKRHNVEVNLKLQEDFEFKGNSDFLDGTVHAMMGDTTFFFYMLEKGKRAIITSDLTPTISLVGRKDLEDNLQEITVGVNRTGLFRLLLENDLKDMLPKVKIKWINNTYERIEALNKGEIDSLVAIEPFVSNIVEEGGKILWSLESSNKNLVMWAFDEDFYNENKQQVLSFHKAVDEAAMYFNSLKEDEKENIVMDICKYNSTLARKMRKFQFKKTEEYKVDDYNLCQEWMLREGEIKNKYPVKIVKFKMSQGTA